MIKFGIVMKTIIYTDKSNLNIDNDVDNSNMVEIMDIPYGQKLNTVIGVKMVGELTEGDIFIMDGKQQVLLNII